MPSPDTQHSGPLILALDTSSSLGSVALARGETVLAFRAFEADRGHSRKLLPMIDSLFTEVGIKVGDIELFAVVIGPGSFTGLRVSLACLRGLAGEKPCFAALAPDVAAWAGRGQGGTVIAITDLFHGEVFGGAYDADGTLLHAHSSGTLDVVLSALGPFVVSGPVAVGSATEKHRDLVHGSFAAVRFKALNEGLAPHLASMAAVQASQETSRLAREILPFYLRDPLTRGLLNTPPKPK